MHITEAHISNRYTYSILQMSQKDIARSENLSTATVSRIINKAIDEGYVTFKLNLPSSNYLELEEKIKTRFNLDYVGVARADIDDQEIIDQDVGKMAADYLNETVRPGNIIVISWGRSMSEMVRQLTPKSVADITVVELNGGVSIGAIDNGAVAVVNRLAKNYDGRGVLLPVPSFVDNEKIARTLMSDTQIKEVFELIRNIDMAVFSVGSIRPDSILIKSGYFTGEEYEKLHIKGYVGDICSRYFKADGTQS